MQFLQGDKMMLHTTESLMKALGLDPNLKGIPGAPPGRALWEGRSAWPQFPADSRFKCTTGNDLPECWDFH
jgi:hypothetical protein